MSYALTTIVDRPFEQALAATREASGCGRDVAGSWQVRTLGCWWASILAGTRQRS